MAAVIVEWGATWEPVAPESPFQQELLVEIGDAHPLSPLRPGVFGRCRACDDVVAVLDHVAGDPELAVVHLTWQGRAEPSGTGDSAWPYFERMTIAQFASRFLRGGEHL